MNALPKCILNDGNSFIELPYYYEYQEKKIRVIRCAACGLGMLHPMLSAEEVASLYQAEYFEKDYHCGGSKGAYAQEIANMRRQFRPFLTLIKSFCSHGKFLEIGCAGGATLAEARAQGFETIGVELSAEMAEWGRAHLQLDIRTGTIEQQNFPDDSFDVIYLGDVIEHLLGPKAVLQCLRRILKPGGFVAFAYPTELNHLAPRMRRMLKWECQSPHKPYHLFYYTTKTLGMLLEQCGFEVKLHHVDKTVRSRPLMSFFADVPNYILTKLTGQFGDRGFTIARAA